MTGRRPYRLLAGTALAAMVIAGVAAPADAAPPKMSRAEIVKLSKTVVGFSYWWGGSKWLPGAKDKGKCTPNAGSSGCPKCSHKGQWGADCSGFVGKAWQIAVAKPLHVAYHPYATKHFTFNSTWWTKISRNDAKVGDAFTYNKNGAGHIFMFEKGNPWGKVWAWECKGCKYGCTYSLRSASSSYIAIKRKLLVAPPPVCTPGCKGSKMVDAKCGEIDCKKSGAKCVKDSVGLRCVSVYCPAKGSAAICLPDGRLGQCSNGKLSASKCTGGKVCVKLAAGKAACKPPCPASCDDNNACTQDGCKASQGVCFHNAAAGPCEDGDPCTLDDTCNNGTCASGVVKACDDGNGCTADACKDGACTSTPKSAACDDGDACTLKDTCAAGACKGVAMACDDGDPCTADMCRVGLCEHPAHKPGAVAGCAPQNKSPDAAGAGGESDAKGATGGQPADAGGGSGAADAGIAPADGNGGAAMTAFAPTASSGGCSGSGRSGSAGLPLALLVAFAAFVFLMRRRWWSGLTAA